MNQIIRQIAEQGYGQVLYNIFFAAGFVAVFLFALIAGKKYKISKWKALVYVICVYTISTLWMFVQCWIENGFKVGAETTSCARLCGFLWRHGLLVKC